MPDNLNLTEAERDIILAHRTAAEAKKQDHEKPVDLNDIKVGMSPAVKRRVLDKISELWK